MADPMYQASDEKSGDCRHMNNNQNNPFYKRTIKARDRGDGSGLQVRPYQLLMDPCAICPIYDVWRRHGSFRVDRVSPDAGGEGQIRVVENEWSQESGSHDSPVLVHLKDVNGVMRPRPGEEMTIYPAKITLVAGQFGEAYHLLICRLLLKQHPQYKFYFIKPTDLDERAQLLVNEVDDLLKWYKFPHDGVNSPPDGLSETPKRQTTPFIAEAFRVANEQQPGGPEKGGGPVDQDGLFRFIRLNLALEPLNKTMHSGTGDHKKWDNELMNQTKLVNWDGNRSPYLGPSYSGKYWLNRYFRLTSQFGASEDQNANKSIKFKRHAFRCMPKQADVGRLAVVHVRHSVEAKADAKVEEKEDNCNEEEYSGVGRILDKKNLSHVLGSIKRANRLCNSVSRNFKTPPTPDELNQVPPRPITHVMLYGDFNYSEGYNMKLWAEMCLNRKERDEESDDDGWDDDERRQDKWDNLHVSFICRPWETPKDRASTWGSTWTSLRDAGRTNPRPAEVDDFWREFRSTEFDPLPVQVKTLGIWLALKDRYGDNICVIGHRSGFIEGAGLIGIPIFYLNNERDDISKSGREFGPGELLWGALKPGSSLSRLRELADVMNTFIPVEALEKKRQWDEKEKREVFRVKKAAEKKKGKPQKHEDKDIGHEKELRAAIFMYMCCRLTSNQARPAWTARIAMTHQEGWEDSPGQTWLRERWTFATDIKKRKEGWRNLPTETGLEWTQGRVTGPQG